MNSKMNCLGQRASVFVCVYHTVNNVLWVTMNISGLITFYQLTNEQCEKSEIFSLCSQINLFNINKKSTICSVLFSSISLPNFFSVFCVLFFIAFLVIIFFPLALFGRTSLMNECACVCGFVYSSISSKLI